MDSNLFARSLDVGAAVVVTAVLIDLAFFSQSIIVFADFSSWNAHTSALCLEIATNVTILASPPYLFLRIACPPQRKRDRLRGSPVGKPYTKMNSL
jgi:hypothetical protein